VAGARRNPGRTAATTAALMIGVGLMSAASVSLATVRATATDQLVTHYPVDYILKPTATGVGSDGIPPALAQRLRGKQGLSTVAEVRQVDGELDGQSASIGTVDPTAQGSLLGAALPLASGSTTDFRSGSVILFTGAPAAKGHSVGDVVTMSTP